MAQRNTPIDIFLNWFENQNNDVVDTISFLVLGLAPEFDHYKDDLMGKPIDQLKTYLLKDDDYLFNINANTSGQFNKKLKQVAVQVLGDGISHPKAQGKYSEISAYDFRHSGTIWWRIKAQENGRISLDSIRQRGGWSDDEMLNYYTKFIGLTGQIKREDLLTEDDKNNLQKDIDEMKKDLKIATSDSEKEKLFNEVYEAVLNRIMEEKGAKKHWIKKAEEEQVYF